jgi:hypothetical protein
MKAKKVYEFRTSGEIVKMGKDSEYMKKHQNKINIIKLEEELSKLDIYFEFNKDVNNKYDVYINDNLFEIKDKKLFELFFDNSDIAYLEFYSLDVSNIKGYSILPLHSETTLNILNNLNIENTDINEFNDNFTSDGIIFAKGSKFNAKDYLSVDNEFPDSIMGILTVISEEEFNNMLNKHGYFNYFDEGREIEDDEEEISPYEFIQEILYEEDLYDKIKI